jgi:hypothetical protein
MNPKKLEILRSNGPCRRLVSASLGLALLVVAGSGFAQLAPVTNDAAGAAALAAAMAANPGVVTGASFVAVPAAGTPHAVHNGPLSSFPTNGSAFAIMTTGNAQFADDPNLAPNTGQDLAGNNVRGDTDLDVTVLKIDLQVPQGANCLVLDFQFYSEEFPEFVNTQFNDAFIAELNASTWTTMGSTISAPGNFAFDPSGNVISINSSGNTSMTPGNAMGTTYDGATPLLSASTPITPGAHSLYLSIFDQGDRIFDSAVFLDNLIVGFVPDPQLNCVPGAVPKNFTMTLTPAIAENPEDTEHTVIATLLEQGNPVPDAPLSFEVTGANTASASTTTGPAGQASFTYLGTNEGSDVITACYDADGDGSCEALASAQKHWLHVNKEPAAACVPTTNPSGKNEPGKNASPNAGMNPDGFYQLLGVDPDGPAPSLLVGDTGSSFVAGPFAPGAKVKITQADGTEARMQSGSGVIEAHLLLNGDAKVWAVDNEGALSAVAICYVPRPPK